MRFEKHIALSFNRLIYHLKSIGLLFFIPLVIIDILIPILNIMEYSKYGIGEELYIHILQYSQWFFPFFSVWWVLFVLREYIESDGNELLYVHADRCKLKDILCLFILYIINITILYFIYDALFPDMKYEFLKILSVCIFYLGITYFFTYLTKSITITLLILILFTLANITYGSNIMIFPLYYTLDKITVSLYINSYLPLMLTGLILLFVGVVLNKRWLKFV